MRIRIGFVLACCAGVLMSASPALAQRDLEIPIQFDFINPGARSLALAGAFIGLADDATAATTNPAGLQRLARPEVSAEGRGWKFFTDFIAGGRLSGTPSGQGTDMINGPVPGQFKDSIGGISFVSFVLPRGRWSVAGYRQEASRLRGSAATNGAFFTAPAVENPNLSQDYREYPSAVIRELDVVNYGGSFAYRAGKVSLGGGFNFSKLNLDSNLLGFDLPADFYGPATTDSPRFSSEITGDSWSTGYSAGVLFVPNDKIQAGASYRRGAKFDDVRGNFVYPEFPDIAGPYTADFKVPDNFGAGFAVRPLDGLTVALDMNRVTYSDLNEFLRAQVRFTPSDREFYSINDATEVHLGGEYVLTWMKFLPAVRGGFWRESEHAVNYTGSDPLYQATTQLAHAVKHYAVGGGIAPSQRFEVNAGFDFSDRANTMSFSGIFRF